MEKHIFELLCPCVECMKVKELVNINKHNYSKNCPCVECTKTKAISDIWKAIDDLIIAIKNKK